jgi:Uma2 family endonuclease
MSAQRGLAYSWLSDDTEDSIVGADWHQDAISSLCNGLRDVARVGSWPWHVGDQLTLVAWHPDGSAWRPKPDIMVHPHSGVVPRNEMDAATDGVPALIIEVASPSTYRSDVNISPPSRTKPDAKGFEYLTWPLPEYLVFDPTEAHLPGQIRAWRTDNTGRPREWRPDVAGRYQSRTLGVSFRPEGFFLRIFDPTGVPIPFDHEKADTIARLERENAALRALIERLRA